MPITRKFPVSKAIENKYMCKQWKGKSLRNIIMSQPNKRTAHIKSILIYKSLNVQSGTFKLIKQVYRNI